MEKLLKYNKSSQSSSSIQISNEFKYHKGNLSIEEKWINDGELFF